MDFLKIRKKAKELARARNAAEAKGAEPEAAVEGAGASERAGGEGSVSSVPTAPPAPVVTDGDVIEGALAARLQGIPQPESPPALDPRFTTWRPGTGSPPSLPPDLHVPPSAFEPREEDFAIVGSGSPAEPAVPRAEAAPARNDPPADPLDDFFYRPDEAAPALPQIAPAARVAGETAASEPLREEYLTFLLGSEEYAIAVESVREVIRAPPVTEVPRAPRHILGVISVRGEVVAVMDPRRRLGIPARPEAGPSKVVIVDAGEGPCGILVDRVASVVRLLPGTIEPCPQGIAGARAEYLAGIGRTGDRLFTVLDAGALLRRVGGRAEGGAASRGKGADAGA